MGIYTISYSRLFKILEWVLVIFLILFSGFFMTDVWEKYTSKDSSFKPYSEPRSMLPTIVVCFKPYAKQSSLNEYNITQQQLFYSEFPEEIENIWDQFYQEAYYQLGKDYTLKYSWGEYELFEGLNEIKEGKNIQVEVLHTIWTGICSKIQFKYFEKENFMTFHLSFNETLEVEDLPQVDIYLTSEVNSNGIKGYGWNFGDELKFTLHGKSQKLIVYESQNTNIWSDIGYEQDYKLKTIMYKYLNLTTPCGAEIYEHCAFNQFDQYEFKCTNPCLAISYNEYFKKSDNAVSDKCETVTDYICMKWEMNYQFTQIFDKCPKYCTATGEYPY